jgi:hypothetical protein
MRGTRSPFWIAALAGVALLPAGIAAAEDIQVLLLRPWPDAKVTERIVEDLEQAIIDVEGPLKLAEHLADAEAIVEITAFHWETRDDGTPVRTWEATYKLVVPPSRECGSFEKAGEPFTMIQSGGTEETSRAQAARMLGKVLAKALGRLKDPEKAKVM